MFDVRNVNEVSVERERGGGGGLTAFSGRKNWEKWRASSLKRKQNGFQEPPTSIEEIVLKE